MKTRSKIHSQRISEAKKRNHPLKGRTYDEYYGACRSKDIRNRQSRSVSIGGVNATRVGKTYEEFYGKDRAEEIKNKLSVAGVNYAKDELKRRNYFRGYLNEIRFDSSYERRFIQYFFSCMTEDYKLERCDFHLNYEYEGNRKRYNPDFIIKKNEIIVAVVEVKSEFVLLKDTNHCLSKFISLKKYSFDHAIFPCLCVLNRERKVINHANPEPSSLDSLILFMSINFNKYMSSEKVQRLDLRGEKLDNGQ